MCSRHVIGARDYVSVSQPPKPPSWRDFILPGGQSKKKGENVKFTDISVIQKASSDSDTNGTQQHIKNKSNSRRYKKSAVHRTRSETHLNNTDLPENHELTMNLAKTKPQLLIREYGIRNEKAIKNAQIYLSHNAQKCKEWLKDVEASEPLDDVAFKKGTGIDVEIPEETWEEHEKPKTVNPTSSQMSLTTENVIRQHDADDMPRVVVHHILVHEYNEALDNTQSISATLAESDGSNHLT